LNFTDGVKNVYRIDDCNAGLSLAR
jgi:hypothetical protein